MAHLLERCGTPRQPNAMSIERRPPPRGGRTPATHYSVACSSGREVHFPYRCGTPRSTDRDVHRAAAPRGSRTPAAGFAPPTRHARPLIFSPHATYRRLISSYKFLLSPPLFPVAAPHRPSAPRGRPSPSGHRGGLLLIPFRSTAARLQRAFFSSSGSARSRRSARPPSGIVSVALPRPPLGGRSPTTSAAQSPESRLCGGLSASIHPLHPPIARAPRL